MDAPRHTCLIPRRLLRERLETLGFREVFATTRDAGGRHWDDFGWRESLAGSMRTTLMKRVVRRLGGALSWGMAGLEASEGEGSAYTVIFERARGEKR